MRFLVLGTLLFVAQGGAAAQITGTAKISGVTVNSYTGRFVPRAQLNLISYKNPPRLYATVADDSGKFEFPSLEAGEYRLLGISTGYAQTEYKQGISSSGFGYAIALQPGQLLVGIQLRLIPLGTISGRLMDKDGIPVAAATIQTFRKSASNGYPSLDLVQQTLSNDRGDYRLVGLAGGTYYLSAIGPDLKESILSMSTLTGMNKSQGQSTSYNATTVRLPSYYPGTSDVSAASPVQLTPGDHLTGIDLKMNQLAAERRISGTITSNSKGQPIISAVLKIAYRELLAPPIQPNIGIKGSSFAISVSPGAYYLVAIPNNTSRQSTETGTAVAQAFGYVSVDVNDTDIQNLTIRCGNKIFQDASSSKVESQLTHLYFSR